MKFRIDASHPSLPGHFPGNPIVPGVVLLDRVCAAIEAAHGGECALRLPQVKFLQPLLPGQEADVELRVVEMPAAGLAAIESGSTETRSTAQRWRFRVVRVADGAALASGEAARP